MFPATSVDGFLCFLFGALLLLPSCFLHNLCCAVTLIALLQPEGAGA